MKFWAQFYFALYVFIADESLRTPMVSITTDYRYYLLKFQLCPRIVFHSKHFKFDSTDYEEEFTIM